MISPPLKRNNFVAFVKPTCKHNAPCSVPWRACWSKQKLWWEGKCWFYRLFQAPPWFQRWFQLCFSFASFTPNYRLCPVLKPSSGLPLRWFYKVLRNCSVLRSSSSPFPLLGLSPYHRLSSILTLSSKHQQSPSGLLFCLGINTGTKKRMKNGATFRSIYRSPPATFNPVTAPHVCSRWYTFNTLSW